MLRSLLDRLTRADPGRPKARAGAESLEPRVLYSADPFGGDDIGLGGAEVRMTQPQLSATALASVAALEPAPIADASDRRQEELPASSLPSTLSQPLATHSAEPEAQTALPAPIQAVQAREIIFVDAAVQGADALVDHLLKSRGHDNVVSVITIAADEDGLAVMTRRLGAEQGVTAVHLISHGLEGTLLLGNSRVDADTLLTRQDEVSAWKQAFSGEADILLWGCDIGSGSTGEALLEELALLTGADVAASTDATGASALGGNWLLERSTGTIETAAMPNFEPDWIGLLAISANGAATTATLNSGTSLSWSHTVAAGDNRVMFVTLAIDGVGANVSSVTYGGVALTQVGRTPGNHAVEIWRLASPTVGTANVVVSLGGTTAMAAGAVVYNGVDLAAPTSGYNGATGTGTVASVATSSATGSLVLDVTNWDGAAGGYAVGPGQSVVWSTASTSNSGRTSTEAGAASVTMSSTVSSSAQWEMAGVSINAANEPPVNTVPGAQSTVEDTPRVFSSGNGNAIAISDADAGGANNQVTLSVTNGTLTLAGIAGLSFSSGDGTADASMSFRGTAAAINTALNGLSYLPTTGYIGGATLTLSSKDSVLLSLDIDADLELRYEFAGNANDTGSGAAQNGTLTNGASIATDVTRGDVLTLDGSNDFVDLSSSVASFASLTQGTIAGWIKATGTLETIFSISDTADTGSYATLMLGTSGYLTFSIVENGVPQLDVYRNSAAINDGNWHHVAVTVGPGGNRLYVDGAQAGAGDLIYDAGNAATQRFFNNVTSLDAMGMGRTTVSSGGQWHTLGQLDDVRLYDRPLSASEIASLANDLSLLDTDTVALSVIVANDPPVNTVPGAQSTNEDTALVFSSGNGNAIAISDADAGGANNQVTLSVTNGTLTLAGTAGLSFTNGDGTADASMNFRGTAAAINAALNGLAFTPSVNYHGGATLTMASKDSVLLSLDIDAQLLGRYEFSGNGNDTGPGTAQNASLVNGAAITTDGTRGQVLVLDGTNDHASIASTFGNPSEVTIGGWVNLSASVSTRREFISIDNRVHIALNEGVNGVKGSIQTAPGVWLDLVSGQSLSPGGWHHLMYSYSDSGNVHKLYIDGALVAEAAVAASVDWAGASTSTIGSHPILGLHLPGMVDDVRIYDRVLSASEVASLANDLALVDIDTVAVTVNAVNDAPSGGTASLFAGINEDDITNTGKLVSDFTASVSDPDAGAQPGIYVHAASNANGQWQYALDGSSWVNFAVVSSNSALLLPSDASSRVRFVPNADWNGVVFPFSFGAWDRTSGSAGGYADVNVTGGSTAFGAPAASVSISVNAVNDAPLNTAPGALVTPTNTALVFSGSQAISVADVDATSLQVSLSVGQGSLTLSTTAGLSFSSGDGSADATMVFTGTAAAINLALDGMFFAPNLGFEGATSLSVTTNDLGSSGSGGALTDTSTIPIQVGAKRFQQGLAGYTGTEDTHVLGASPTTGFGNNTTVVSDDTTLGDAALLRFDNLFGSAPGQIPAGSTITSASLSFYVTQPDSLDTVTIHQMLSAWSEASTYNSLGGGVQANGSEASVATLMTVDAGQAGWVSLTGLAGLVQSWANGSANHGFAFLSHDADNWAFASSEHPTASLRPYLTVNYTPPQPAQVTTSGGQAAYTENAPAVPVDPGLVLSDVDSTHLVSATVAITAGYVSGQDTLTFSNQSGITGAWNSGTGVLTLTGTATVAQYEAALRSVAYLNASDSPNTSSRTVSFTVQDAWVSGGTDTRNVTVTAVNDAPQLTNGAVVTLASTNEDTPSSATVVNTLLTSAGWSDADTGALRGVAVTGVTGNGTWQYSTDGTNWTAVGAVSASNALLLNSASQLRYLPDGLNGETATLAFRAWDQHTGSASAHAAPVYVAPGAGGAATAYSTQSASASLVVTAVNDAPAIALPGTNSTGVNTPLVLNGTHAIQLSDADAGGNPVQLTLGVTNGTLSLATTAGLSFSTGDGSNDSAMVVTGTVAALNAALDGLSFTPLAAFVGSASLSVNVQDLGHSGTGGTQSDSGAMTIQVGGLRFQEGASGYTGTQDTFVRQFDINTAFGSSTVVELNNWFGFAEQGLIRFDNLLGLGAGQIPAGSTITTASLSVYVSHPNNMNPAATVSLHRMLAPWSEGSTWNSVNSGIQTNNAEAVSSASSTISAAQGGWVTFSGLASDLQAWALGQSNEGWAIVTDDLDAWNFHSSEVATVGLRPYLTISYVAPQAAQVDLDANNSSGASGTAFAGQWTENGGPVAIVDADASVIDSDSAQLVSMTISITNRSEGVLESLAANTAGTAISASFNAGTGVLSLSGNDSVAHYQQVLRTVVYNNTSESPGTAARLITVQATDAYAQSNTATATISVVAVNDAPAFTGLDATPSFTEGGSAVVLDSNVSVQDAELSAANNYNGATLSLARQGGAQAQDQFVAVGSLGTLTHGGTLSVGGTPIGTVVSLAGGSLVLSFNASATTALVNATLQQIAYANSSEAPPASVQINWSFSDGNAGAQGSGGALTATGSSAVTIMAVNDAPTLSNGAVVTLPATDEDTPSAGTLVGDILTAAGWADVDGPAPRGIAIQAATGNGTWQYSTDGSTWTPLGAVTSSNALLLASGSQVRYVPDNINSESVSFSFVAWDQSSGSASANGAASYAAPGAGGGSSAFSSQSASAALTVSAINDAPTFTAASLSLSEGQTVTLSPANVSVTDPDSGSFSFNVSGLSGGYFQLSSAPGSGITSFTSAQLTAGLVQWVDDGDETAPAFSLTASDGALSSNTLAAVVTYTPVNDAPVLVAATLSLSEGETLTLTPANFTVSDPDNNSFTFNIIGVSGGYFRLSSAPGSAITSFTSAQLAAGQVQWVDDGDETAPAFSVSVNDGGLNSNTLAATVSYTPVNDAPLLTTLNLSVGEGNTVSLSPADLAIVDPDHSSFTFNISGLSGGYFQLSGAAGIAITSFSSAQLSAGLVQFVDDGDELAPAFSLTASDGALASNALAATVSYTPVNDAPVLAAASLSLGEGDTVTWSPAQLTVTDPDSSSFTFNIIGLSGGYFQLSTAAGSAVTTFTSAQLAAGLVQFVDDGDELTPAFSITASDGALASNTLAVTVSYTPVNDAPVAIAAHLALDEAQTVTLSPANFTVNDPDSSSFTFNVSGLSGGFFQLSSAVGVAVSSFTSAQLAAGLVQFVDDGDELAPAFSVTASDGSLSSNTLASTVTFTPVNDATMVMTAALSLTEGETVTLSPANITVTDPDNGSFTYSVSGLSGGYFQLSTAAGSALTSFSSAQLAAGLVQFVDDGDEVAPAFSITASDGALNSNTLVAAVSYSPVNDAPVLNTSNLLFNAITEDDLNNTGQTVASLLASAGSPAVFDADAGALPGLALVGSDAGNGSWQFSTDGGASWQALGSVSDAAALLLGGEDRLRLVPNGLQPTTASLTLRAWDRTSGAVGDRLNIVATGGSAAFSTTTTEAALSVNAVNDAPTSGTVVLTPMTEDSGPRLITQALLLALAHDVDGDALQALDLRISSGAGNLLDNGDGSWTFTPALNFNGTVVFSFEVSDGVTVTPVNALLDITPVNDAPVSGPVTLNAINEDSGPRLITQAELLSQASDVDADALRASDLSISSGGGNLVANGDGTWTYTPDLNHNGTVQFSYRISDDSSGGNLSAAVSASLDINAVNDAPVLQVEGQTGSANFTRNENTTAVVTLSARDVDDALQSLRFTVVGGADAALFTLDSASGELRFSQAPDYERPADANADGEYELVVRVTDPAGEQDEMRLRVRVSDVNDAPVLRMPDAIQFDSQPRPDQVVATVGGNDQDAGDRLRFALLSDAEGRFVIDAQTGEIRYTGAAPAAQGGGSVHLVVVEVTDSLGGRQSRTLALRIPGQTTLPDSNLVAANTPFEQSSDTDSTLATTDDKEDEPLPPTWTTGELADDELARASRERIAALIRDLQSGDSQVVLSNLARNARTVTISDLGPTVTNAEAAEVNSILDTVTAWANGAGDLQTMRVADLMGRQWASSRRNTENGADEDEDALASGTRKPGSEPVEELLLQLTKVEHVAGVGLSVGLVWWLTRGGGLLASALMGAPAWKQVDLLAVMKSRDEEDDDDDAEDESDEVKELFQGRAARTAQPV